MADKNYVITLNVDASGAVSNLGEVEQQISDTSEKTLSLKQQLRALQLEMQNLDPADARFEELSQQAGELKDQINDTSEAIRNNAGNAFEGLSNNASTLGSRLLSMDFAGAGQSAKAMGANIKNINLKTFTTEIGAAAKGFVSLAKAILANPIFLIATAIIAIGAALKGVLDSQREDVDNANKAIDNSNAQRHEQERKRIAAAGSDEKKLAEIKKQSIADDISDTEKKINNLVRQERTAYGISEEQEKELAKLREQLSKQRIDQEVLALDQINKLNSQRASIEERLLESGLTARERERRQIDLKYQKEIEAIKAVGGTQEDVNKILQLQQIEANDLSNKFAAEDAQKRKQAAEERKKKADEEKAAREKAAEEKKDAEEKNQKEINDLMAQLEAENRKELEESEKKKTDAKQADLDKRKKAEEDYDTGIKAIRAEQDAANLTQDEKDIIAIDNKYLALRELAIQAGESTLEIDAAYKAALEQQEKESGAKSIANQRAIQNAKLQSVSDALGAIMAVNDAFSGDSEREQEKAFQRNKAFSIAQALISTYLAVSGALTAGGNPVKLATGAQFVEAGIALTAGLANVAKIAKTQFKSGTTPSSTGGGNIGSIGGGGGGTMGAAPTFNPIDFSILGQRPIQANQSFVLAGQVSNAQDANAKIKDLSRL